MSKNRKTLYYAMAEEFVVPGEEDDDENNGAADLISGDKANNSSDNEVDTLVSEEQHIEINKSGDDNLVTSGDNSLIGSSTSGELDSSSSDQNISDSGDNRIDENNVKNDDNTKIEVSSGDGENIVIDDLTLSDDHSDEDTDEEVEYDTYITSIKYSTSSKRVKIKYTGDIKYSDSIITNPNRVILDVENAKLDTTGPTEIEVKNSIITSIRFSQYSKTTVRVVLDIDTRGNYRVFKKSSEIQIEVEEATYQNIKYKKNKSNSQITLQGVNMADVRYEQNDSKNKLIIGNSKVDFGFGTLEVDDDFIQNIKTDKNEIVVLYNGSLTFAFRQSSTNVIITVREKTEKEVTSSTPKEEEKEEQEDIPVKEETVTRPTKVAGKKTILIDVGHGGKDPGACNGDAQEKVYNLNIALYLYDMLKSREDIVVFIDREDNDTYLNREDRVAYATDINPDFIVSVHNNSVENKSYTGTMVLYYNNDTESDFGDITSSECAEIILKELIKNLDTVNRGIVNRGDLHILSKTPCPSVLCEVCFVSNDAELERLKTKSFQKSAAEAIYNGIDKILKEF